MTQSLISVSASPRAIDSKSLPSAAADYCWIMSLDQATTAAGIELVTASELPDAPGCVYESADETAFVAFEFTDQAFWDGIQAHSHLNIAIGDKAIFYDEGGVFWIAAKRGEMYFTVAVKVPVGRAHPALEVAKSVAAAVLAARP